MKNNKELSKRDYYNFVEEIVKHTKDAYNIADKLCKYAWECDYCGINGDCKKSGCTKSCLEDILKNLTDKLTKYKPKTKVKIIKEN